jgi:DNA-binding winged helix-turn-helix (wHTH) protein
MLDTRANFPGSNGPQPLENGHDPRLYLRTNDGRVLTPHQIFRGMHLGSFFTSLGVVNFNKGNAREMLRHVIREMPNLPGAEDFTPADAEDLIAETIDSEGEEVKPYAGHLYDPEGHILTCPNEAQIRFTRLEGRIFWPLFANPERVISNPTLLRRGWGYDGAKGDISLIKTHISHIREKLGKAGDQGKDQLIVKARPWLGYYLLSRADESRGKA